jgi:hypothetical protein
MELDYPLFYDASGQNTPKEFGRHIKATYKTTNCASFNATAISCIEDKGWRHIITKRSFINSDGEIKEGKPVINYYLNGMNALGQTDDLIWEDDTHTELRKESYEVDERDENGLGFLYQIEAARSFIGLEVNAQEARLASTYQDLPLVYCEEERMSLSVDIEPSAAEESRLNLMTGYIDADPIRVVQYPSVTSFNQSKKYPIHFGSNECDVLVYRFKVYTRNLSNQKTAETSNEIYDDYIADMFDPAERLASYNRNNFLNLDGTIDIEKLQKTCPDLRIILITCDRFTKDKNDKVKGCTVEHILPSGGPKDHWIAENVQVKGQGTSSNAYGTSARNIDIKLNKKVIKDEEGKEVELDYALKY